MMRWFLKWLWRTIGFIVLIEAIVVVVAIVKFLNRPQPGDVVDEAMSVGRTPDSFPSADDDYFKDMDRGVKLTVDEIKGRNTWMVWTAGNDRFWDLLINDTFGAWDLLKTVSSHPSIQYCGNKRPEYGYAEEGYGAYATEAQARYLKDQASPAPYPPSYLAYEDDECKGEDRQFYEVSRQNRWKYFGLVNEPGYQQWQPKDCDWKNDKKTAEQPYGKCGDPERFGLWLDKPADKPDPFEDEKKYPGVKLGARGKTVPVGSYYGYATGIVGLRLFPNPDFDEAAKKKWDPVKYYTDPKYYEDKNLVRPYRVGMSCGFCHVGPSPVKPPVDPETPKWENLNANPGAQYFRFDRIFFWNPTGRQRNFIYQQFHTSLPGSLDTSLIANDAINNPRAMNALYGIATRLKIAKFHPERLSGAELNNRQLSDYKSTKALADLFEPPDKVFTGPFLKDGADSVGVLGALNRAYINIGLFSEEWLQHFMPLIGNFPGKRITPIEITVLEKKSTYWQVTTQQTPDVVLFLLKVTRPDYLKDAPGGDTYLADQTETPTRGKLVFAENCAKCHSSKQPPNLCVSERQCSPGQILENSTDYLKWMRAEVLKNDFLSDNLLSAGRRIPINALGTNACSALATNGLRGDIWDNFTSTTYKELPAVGKITVHHPITGKPSEYEMPGGGRGYARPASLISLWSTAPFLLNNSVGTFYGEPSVQARMASFNDSIQQMVWPETRKKDSLLGDRVPGYIQRTTSDSYLKVSWGYLPGIFSVLMSSVSSWFPSLFNELAVKIGPIPKGTPVGPLSNLPFASESTRLKEQFGHFKKVIQLMKKAAKGFDALSQDPTDERARQVFDDLVDPLLELSKCPDYVVNRGHYFGKHLSDDDKHALIEFLKTF